MRSFVVMMMMMVVAMPPCAKVWLPQPAAKWERCVWHSAKKLFYICRHLFSVFVFVFAKHILFLYLCLYLKKRCLKLKVFSGHFLPKIWLTKPSLSDIALLGGKMRSGNKYNWCDEIQRWAAHVGSVWPPGVKPSPWLSSPFLSSMFQWHSDKMGWDGLKLKFNKTAYKHLECLRKNISRSSWRSWVGTRMGIGWVPLCGATNALQ